MGILTHQRTPVYVRLHELRRTSVDKGYYRSSGQGFRAGLRRVVVYHVPWGAPAQCASVAWAHRLAAADMVLGMGQMDGLEKF